jgi:hypothetical protein
MDSREFKKVYSSVTGLGMVCPKREMIQDDSLLSTLEHGDAVN